MFTTKIRAGIVVLGVSAAVAVGVAPSAFALPAVGPGDGQTAGGGTVADPDGGASPAKNDGRYGRSAEALQKARVCDLDLGLFNDALQKLRSAQATGDQKAIAEARDQANSDLTLGWEDGCNFAS
jgi:hypothetical protein